MWFKNVRAYRLTSPFDLSPEKLDKQLAGRDFQPCASSQAVSMGWVPPLGEESEQLVHAAAGCLLFKMRREEKLLPATVVREQLEEKVATIETEQARKVYRKERLNLKDEIVQDCLPRAFTRSSHVFAYIDIRANWIFIDAASANRAEELLNLLRECIGSFPVLLPQVNNSPAKTMTSWLVNRKLPDDFTAGQECELRDPGEEEGVVRCRGVDLFSEEVETHLHAGKQVAHRRGGCYGVAGILSVSRLLRAIGWDWGRWPSSGRRRGVRRRSCGMAMAGSSRAWRRVMAIAGENRDRDRSGAPVVVAS